ncbi:MAG TPA: TolC family protein [Candidatus Sulfotelmatobacter sp.]|nr:TolC family protein [Candidatus Sulfotelmatobacter sp.]
MSLLARALGVLLLLSSLGVSLAAQSPPSRHITLQEAVQLAVTNNHAIRIAEFQTQEKQHAKDEARSHYLPGVTNASRIFTVTDSQFIEIPAGSLGTVDGTPIPAKPDILSQGGKTFVVSGTTLSQPLTQLFTRVKPLNDVARADLEASRETSRQTVNEVKLRVRQIYYQLLITQLHRNATEAKTRAAGDLERERIEQVKYGSSLDEQLIESKAETLQAKQDLLTTELRLSDLTMQLDDVMGLPVTTALELDPVVPDVPESCPREECLRVALASHPEILAARAEVEKASAGVRLAKADYIPDVSAFASYSYQSDVPFLARNFGTFGAQFTWDLFDGGRRHSAVQESADKLAQAKENLLRVTDDVELRVSTALNKLDRTKEMVDVSQELLALRTESSRVTAEQLSKGAALPSQADAGIAQELEAKALFLTAQLDYVQAHDELIEAMGDPGGQQ